jgi:hypothetical protein
MPSSNVLRISIAAAALVALFGGVAFAGGSSPSSLAVRLAASDDVAGDISGPCDEAEHANDQRCTGAGDDDRHGNSGPGNAEDGDDDNSGPGNADDDDDDDRSGHRGGDDDRHDDDSSGHGRGGDDR